MKTLLRRIGRDWEKSCLWASVGVLVLLVALQLSALLPRKEAETVRPAPMRTTPSYLNEATAFAFLQPPRLDEPPPNPFAFALRLPPPPEPTKPPPAKDDKGSTATADAGNGDTTAPAGGIQGPPPPPLPQPVAKRVASVLYRGLYRGGSDAPRQVAFLSTSEAPGSAPTAVVLSEGESAGGVTLKRFTPNGIVVVGPTGQEVAIDIGRQAVVALE